LFEGVGLQEASRFILRIGEDDVIDDLDHPSIVTFGERRTCSLQQTASARP